MNGRKTKSCKKKPKKVEKSDEAEQIIHEFEKIIKSKKRNMLWLAYQQGKVFKKLKENAKFIEIVKQFGSSKSSTIQNKTKIKNSSLPLNLLKNYFILIKELCEENASKSE